MSITAFTGFKTWKAPSFTVTCPQSGYQYEVRSLNVGEITRIKESLITNNRLTELMLDITWDAIQKDTLPEHIKTKEDFEACTTTNDRTAIIYGIYYITFGSSKEYELTCGFCGHKAVTNIDYSDFFRILPYPKSSNIIESYKVSKVDSTENELEEMEEIIEENTINDVLKKFVGKRPPIGQPEGMARTEAGYEQFFAFFDDEATAALKLSYDEVLNRLKTIQTKIENVASKKEELSNTEITNLEDILNKRIEVKLNETGIITILKAPTIKNERILHNKLILNDQKQLSIATDTLFIDKFVEYEEGKQVPVQIVSDPIDILAAYYSLPKEDREQLIELYEKEFGQYGMELLIKWDCLGCSERNELEVDIIDKFFRTVTFTR